MTTDAADTPLAEPGDAGPIAGAGSSSQPAAGDTVLMSDVSFAWATPAKSKTANSDKTANSNKTGNGNETFGIHVDRFHLPTGSRTLLLGPSGSGKSTLLSLLAGIVAPQTGQIEITGTDIVQLGASARDRFRSEHIGVIFQMFNLLPYGTVIDNVVLPLSFAPERAKRVPDASGEAIRLLTALGLEEHQLTQTAATLSVGQQQRVAAARALIGEPELIIADEPTSALDEGRQQIFLDLLFSRVREAQSTLLMVSHDARLGDRFDQVLHLNDVVRRGPQ